MTLCNACGLRKAKQVRITQEPVYHVEPVCGHRSTLVQGTERDCLPLFPQSTGLMTHLDGPIFTNMFIPMPMGADPFMGAGTHTPFAAIQRHPNPYASFIGAVQGVDPIEQAAKAAATSLSRSSSQGLPAYLPPQTFSGYGLVGTPQLPVQMNNGTIPYHTQSVAAAGQPIMMPCLLYTSPSPRD